VPGSQQAVTEAGSDSSRSGAPAGTAAPRLSTLPPEIVIHVGRYLLDDPPRDTAHPVRDLASTSRAMWIGLRAEVHAERARLRAQQVDLGQPDEIKRLVKYIGTLPQSQRQAPARVLLERISASPTANAPLGAQLANLYDALPAASLEPELLDRFAHAMVRSRWASDDRPMPSAIVDHALSRSSELVLAPSDDPQAVKRVKTLCTQVATLYRSEQSQPTAKDWPSIATGLNRMRHEALQKTRHEMFRPAFGSLGGARVLLDDTLDRRDAALAFPEAVFGMLRDTPGHSAQQLRIVVDELARLLDDPDVGWTGLSADERRPVARYIAWSLAAAIGDLRQRDKEAAAESPAAGDRPVQAHLVATAEVLKRVRLSTFDLDTVSNVDFAIDQLPTAELRDQAGGSGTPSPARVSYVDMCAPGSVSRALTNAQDAVTRFWQLCAQASIRFLSNALDDEERANFEANIEALCERTEGEQSWHAIAPALMPLMPLVPHRRPQLLRSMLDSEPFAQHLIATFAQLDPRLRRETIDETLALLRRLVGEADEGLRDLGVDEISRLNRILNALGETREAIAFRPDQWDVIVRAQALRAAPDSGGD
jgi:hypothetical protein